MGPEKRSSCSQKVGHCGLQEDEFSQNSHAVAQISEEQRRRDRREEGAVFPPGQE